MPLTFTFDEGFLETPDETQKDAIKLAKLVVEWWTMPFKDPEYVTILKMVEFAKQILEKENAANILR